MEIVIVIIFVVGYVLIALEHPIKINKTATALLTGVLCWALFVMSDPPAALVQSDHYQSFIDGQSKQVGIAAATSRAIRLLLQIHGSILIKLGAG